MARCPNEILTRKDNVKCQKSYFTIYINITERTMF